MKNYTITVNGVAYDVTVEEGKGAAAPAVRAAAPAAPAAGGAAGAVSVSAPMPGKILAVKKKVGEAVKAGDPILVLEAMKMENDIVAPQDGTIATIEVAVGDAVESGATLATMN
ncbi:biotin/lipoyl-binding protein [Oribacterium sp. oral taxon 102]|uniref:biotin/lipoyl-containing protein n=1 Tax=Oribacterium sp. oral taxon 102 TaxID=671214 RepID=UPI0015BFE997|nr:biotin/lipoyl-containing protein [Oribacterium sp. oral taxon 102]NWO21575.1 biotin/lipoyl-binding protein [Oribacterium sp. oral taxon 102]